MMTKAKEKKNKTPWKPINSEKELPNDFTIKSEKRKTRGEKKTIVSCILK